MVDIYRELSEISVSEFGLEVREPIYTALSELKKLGDVPEEFDTYLRIIRNSVTRGSEQPLALSGDEVIKAFMKASLYIRSIIRTKNCDNELKGMYNNFITYSFGNRYRGQIHRILKGLMDGHNDLISEEEYSHFRLNGTATLLVGNDSNMFKINDNAIGIKLVFPDEVGTDEMTITIENLLTDCDPVVETYTPETATEGYTYIFTDDLPTLLLDPGLVRIKVTDSATGHIRGNIIIDAYYCNFGMNEPEGFFPVSDDDFIFTDDFVVENGSKTLFYIGTYKFIKMPSTLGGDDVITLGNCTFMNTDVRAVKISPTVRHIE